MAIAVFCKFKEFGYCGLLESCPSTHEARRTNGSVHTAEKYSSYAGEISPAIPNLVNRDFHADAPNTKWLTDITEFSIPAGKVYLSPIIDCFDWLVVACQSEHPPLQSLPTVCWAKP